MSENAAQREESFDELIGRLAEDYSSRLSAGEKPDVEQYAAQHPSAAVAIRQILPAVEIMGAGPCSRDGDGDWRNDVPNELLGDFEIIRELGRGGMGVVYEARQRSLNRRVALKVLPFAAVLDERQVQRFRNEALAVAQLDHPHIVDAYGMGCERSVHFYAMRYVQGETLAQRIQELRSSDQSIPFSSLDAAAQDEKRTTRCNQDSQDTTPAAGLLTHHASETPEYCKTVARIGIEVAMALDHAHQQGIIHRDIKPANIIIDRSGKSWVTDFGLARTLIGSTLTRTGDMLGTLRFMSPEQALGKRAVVDQRTDIYSLGATLYELTTLAPVFAACEQQEALRQIAFDEPRPPRQINRDIPDELATIVLMALAKDPRDRYETAQEMADDLQRFLEDRPVNAKRPTLAQRFGRWCKRHRRIVWLATAVLLVATLASTLSATLIWSEKRRTDAALAKARENFELAEEQRRLAQQRTGEAELAMTEADRQSQLAQLKAAEALAQHRRASVHLSIALLLLELEPRLTQVRTWLDGGSADATGMIEMGKLLVQEHPEDRSAWKLLAEAYDSAGQHAEALEQFEKYRQEYPDSAHTHNRVAWLLANGPDESLRDPMRAIPLARNAVKLAPKKPWILNTLGVAHYRAGNLHQAIAVFENSLSQGWDDGYNSFFLAMCHSRLGNDYKARKWYATGLKEEKSALPITGRELNRIRQEAERLLGIQQDESQLL